MRIIYSLPLKYLFQVFAFFLFAVNCYSQVPEREPNNTFETADTTNASSLKTGSINNTNDVYDYFVAVFPADGTLKIYVQGTNNSTFNGYLYLTGWDRRKGSGQIFGRYISNNSNVSPGATVRDTITIYGRAADSFYFRQESTGAWTYNLSYDIIDTSANDTEPNNSFEEGTYINQKEEKNGHISYVKSGVVDQHDYYRTYLTKDGTLKIYIKGTNHTGTNSYLYLTGWDRRKGSGQVFGRYISNSSNIAAGATVGDTITIYSRAADSFYFRIESTGAWNYKISYDVLDTSENDIESNDAFENSTPINATEEKKGHINYVKNGAQDQYDHYRTIVPVDGTLKIYVEGTNTSGTNGYLYLVGFDKRKGSGQIFGTYISGSSNIAHGTTISDSISVFGVLADTFYFRVQSSGSFKYKLRYIVTQNSELDEEPNNTFEQSLPIRQGLTKNGQVGYVTGGVRDNFDYYSTMLPADGTVKIYVKGTNNSGTNGYLYLTGWDRRKGSGQIFGRYISGSSNIATGATVYDTITLYGRAADSFYFRMESTGAWSYSIGYDVIDTSANDTEPNNTFEEGTNISQHEEKTGHISYAKNGGVDAYDYYKTMLGVDGTLKIYVKGTNNSGTNSYLYTNGWDRRKSSGHIFGRYISGSSNVAAGATVYDTITLHGRAADSFYFRFEAPGAWSYSFKYDIIDSSENDIEPNNTYEASIAINQLEIKKGHINYIKSGISDQYDYYRAVLPTDGSLKLYVSSKNHSGTNGYLYLTGWDQRKGSGQVFGRYISNSSNIPAGATITDTFIINCRAADTFYFRFESAGGAFSYSFKYEMIDTSANDIEPNNTFETALPTIIGATFKGHINYIKSGVQDNNDYYKAVLPSRGIVKIIVEATNTNASNGYIYLTTWDRRKSSGQILGRYISNSSNILPGATIRDTIIMNCVDTDTFYLRWESSGCFRYSFKLSVTDLEPKADFDYTRVGNRFGFSMNVRNSTSHQWDLGNGTTTTRIEPLLTTYGPGFYQVKLIATNTTSACTLKDTAVKTFTVKGIEKYTPHTGGPGNILFTVYGGGLNTNVVVKLTQGGKVYLDSNTIVNSSGNIYTCIVDLHDAPLGFYDVDIITQDSTYHYNNGFKLEALRDYLRVEIVGRELIRTNTDNFYTLRVHNDGNTLTGVSQAYLLTAPNIAVTLLDSLIRLEKSQYVDPDTLPDAISVTRAQGFPIDGDIRGYYLSGIPQGGYKDIRFKFRFQSGVGDVYAWSTGPVNGSAERPWLSDCWKARLKHAYNVFNFGADVIPIVDCAWNSFKLALGTISFFGNGIAGNYESGSDVSTAYGSLVKTGLKTVKNCGGEFGVAVTGLGGLAIETGDIASDILINAPEVEESWYEWDAACGPKPNDKTRKKTDARNSFDPNAKTGPSGIGTNRYINGSDRLMNYAVFFENLSTATLPAQEVTVLDTLDKNVFDLTTFKVGSFGIAYSSYSFSNDVQEYITDMVINNDISVRANMKLDTATGILKTSFKTIDRATGDLTQDPLEGFLPPNVNSPEGNGYFTYSIKMKEGLADGTRLNNKAVIVFDENAPIATEVFTNTLDIVKPTSTITSVTANSDTSATITSMGNDATSGVESFKLYVSTNGASYKPSGTVGKSVNFTGTRGNTYNFYVVAIDSVGNVEDKAPTSEGSIAFNSTSSTVNLSVSSNAGTETSATSITVTATASAPVSGDQTVT
ncbi:MAG TPA: hypothetical protein VF622_05935 [Segetibacter sp.]